MCKKQILFITIFFVFLLLFPVTKIWAQFSCITNNDTCKDLSPSDKVQCYDNKTALCKKESNNLSAQIQAFNNSIVATNLRITQTEQQIENLTEEIASISAKMDNLESSLTTLSNAFIERIIASYKKNVHNNIGLLLLASPKISDFLVNLSYLQIVQLNDRKILLLVEATKVSYGEQKQLREEKKKQQLQLQDKLSEQKASLDEQKKEKEAFLLITKNNASEYQRRYEEAQAELQALQKVRTGSGNVVSVGPVKTGDIVGYMITGNSPCSSGTHLHFEVHKNGSIVDPSAYLKDVSYSYDYDTSLISDRISPSGSWNWPVNDKILIEQGYGMTYWAKRGWYGGGPHTGIDMYSDSSLQVKAVQDGTLYRGAIACGGGTLQFARVDQADGLQTFYFHITP